MSKYKWQSSLKVESNLHLQHTEAKIILVSKKVLSSQCKYWFYLKFQNIALVRSSLIKNIFKNEQLYRFNVDFCHSSSKFGFDAAKHNTINK